ncbi:hypothetical protein DPX16_18912 [Anabarilius grahami]|uniref:Uncharacterized protein n=1 Tax=Anabarilius grahami TaxID=495550 RepID=A0A3N0YLS5_ANAGA|nr:hypothetical protein DPX16_18912 [Anabarilius grahami]
MAIKAPSGMAEIQLHTVANLLTMALLSLRDAAYLCKTEKGKRERETETEAALFLLQGPPVSGWRQQLRSNLEESCRAPLRLAHSPRALASQRTFRLARTIHTPCRG